jgi:putative FmdB family regulatory protein
MPFYDYKCSSCGQQFEVLQKLGDPAPSGCPSCGQDRLTKVISAPAIQSSTGGSAHVHGPGCRH